VFTLDTGTSRTVSILDGDTITYNLLMGQNVIVHYGAKHRGGRSYKKMPIRVIDCQNGKCLKEEDIELNGEMYFLKNDRSIVCEIGY
jgi:hypothetical protein